MFCYNCNSINFDNDYDGEEKLGKRKKMAGSPGDDEQCDGDANDTGDNIGDDDDGIDDHGDNNDTWDIGDDEKFGSSSPGTLD